MTRFTRAASSCMTVGPVVLLLMPLVGGTGFLYQKVDAQEQKCGLGGKQQAGCRNAEGHGHVTMDGGLVKINLAHCDDGSVARWHPGSSGVVTFKVNDWVGVTEEVVSAVREGALEWNRAQPFYALKETAARDADIVIEVFDQVFPGIVGATKVRCKSGHEGIRSAAVYLGVKALAPVAVRNMAAHEFGHALGLGHSDKSRDLMDSRLAEKDVDTRIICPSNLDRGGLIAGFHSYAMPQENWVEMNCSTRTRS